MHLVFWRWRQLQWRWLLRIPNVRTSAQVTAGFIMVHSWLVRQPLALTKKKMTVIMIGSCPLTDLLSEPPREMPTTDGYNCGVIKKYWERNHIHRRYLGRVNGNRIAIRQWWQTKRATEKNEWFCCVYQSVVFVVFTFIKRESYFRSNTLWVQVMVVQVTTNNPDWIAS